MADIAEIGFAYDPSGLKKAKADLEAIVIPAKKVEAAKIAVAKADLESARAALAAAKASGTATKEQIAAATAAIRKQTATLAMAKADAAAAGAAEAVGRAGQAAAGGLGAAGRAGQAAAGGIAAAGNAANGATKKLDNLGKAANDNLNAVQATPANIAAQFQDIGVTAAAGMNPLLIALQQGTQLSVAFSGGLGGIGAALKQVFSPMALLTIGIVAGAAALIQWGMSALNASDKSAKLASDIDAVKFSSSGLGNAQSILGTVMDLTTGKINTQSTALIGLAKAQLTAAKIQSQAREIEARSKVQAAANPNAATQAFRAYGQSAIGKFFAPETALGESPELKERNVVETLARSYYDRSTIYYKNANKVMDGLRRAAAARLIKDQTLVEQLAIYSTMDVEAENRKMYEDAEKALNGDVKATQQFLKPTKPDKVKKASTGKTDTEKEADHYKELVSDLNNYNSELDRNAGAIGLVGAMALEYNKQTEIYARAAEQNIDLTIGERQAVIDLAIAKAAAQQQANVTLQAYYDEKNAILENIASLNAEKDAMSLSAGAATMLAYERKLLNDERFRGIIYSDAEKQRLIELKQREIDLTEEVKNRRTEVEKTEKQMEFNRSTTRGFFTDFVQGARDGKGAWQSFADAFNNVMDRIVDKLLNEVLDAIFQVKDAASSGSGGGLLGILGSLGSLFGSGLGDVGSIMAGANASLGAGTPGMVGAFAKGDTFTNSVVSRPTAFAFGKGGANLGIMGEAGDEAVMPLTRGADGSLGVQMYGDSNQAPAQMQEVVVRVVADDARFDAYVDSRIATSAPQVAQAGAAISQRQQAFQQTRKL